MHFILGIFVYGYFYVDVYFMLFKIIAPMQKNSLFKTHYLSYRQMRNERKTQNNNMATCHISVRAPRHLFLQ